MVGIGCFTLPPCLSSYPSSMPFWLCVAGAAVLIFPCAYFVYDKICKGGCNGVVRGACNLIVVLYISFGVGWTLLGFRWTFGEENGGSVCGDELSYRAAAAGLVAVNAVMDGWICFKITVVLYWAFLSEE